MAGQGRQPTRPRFHDRSGLQPVRRCREHGPIRLVYFDFGGVQAFAVDTIRYDAPTLLSVPRRRSTGGCYPGGGHDGNFVPDPGSTCSCSASASLVWGRGGSGGRR